MRLNDVTGDLDSAWEALESVFGTRFLNNDIKYKGYALIPYDVRSERQRICDVVEVQVWRELKVGRVLIVDVNLWQIITFWVNQLWEVVYKDLTNYRLK